MLVHFFMLNKLKGLIVKNLFFICILYFGLLLAPSSAKLFADPIQELIDGFKDSSPADIQRIAQDKKLPPAERLAACVEEIEKLLSDDEGSRLAQNQDDDDNEEQPIFTEDTANFILATAQQSDSELHQAYALTCLYYGHLEAKMTAQEVIERAVNLFKNGKEDWAKLVALDLLSENSSYTKKIDSKIFVEFFTRVFGMADPIELRLEAYSNFKILGFVGYYDDNQKHVKFIEEESWNQLDAQFKTNHAAATEAAMLSDLGKGSTRKKTRAFALLWGDKELRHKHIETLEAYALDCFHNGNSKAKYNAFEHLWQDAQLKTKHLDMLSAFAIDRLQHGDTNTKNNVFYYLWQNTQLKAKYLDKLTAFVIDRLQHGETYAKNNAFQSLWQDDQIKSKHLPELGTYLVDLLQKGDTIDKKNAFDKLWFEPQLQNSNLEPLGAYLETDLLNGNEDQKSEAFDKLWRVPQLKTKYFDNLVNYNICRLQNNNEWQQKHAFDLLSRETELKPEHSKVLDTYVAASLQNSNPNARINFFSKLWYSPQLKTKYLPLLGSHLADNLKNGDTKDKEIAFDNLWADEKLKANHIGEIGAYLVGLLQNATMNIKLTTFDKLWNDRQLKANHLDALEAFLLEFLLNGDDAHKSAGFKYLWRDAQLKLRNLDALGLYLLRLLKEADSVCEKLEVLLMVSSEPALVEKFASHLSLEDHQLLEQVQKLEHYLRNISDATKPGFDEFLTKFWSRIDRTGREDIIKCLIQSYGAENIGVQELLLLHARAGVGRSSIGRHAEMLSKLKERYEHRPSSLLVRLEKEKDGVNKEFKFIVSPQNLSYIPASQTPQANFEDVKALLGKHSLPEKASTVLSTPQFQQFFTSTSEEAIMLQSMVKKFRTMEPPTGRDRMIVLMIDMYQCKTGMHQAIIDHYSVESEQLPKANLKNIEVWRERLLDTTNPYVTNQVLTGQLGMTREDLGKLILNMLQKGHIFHDHMTELHSDNARRVLAVFGKLVAAEKDVTDKAELGKNLVAVLRALKDLRNPATFCENLCKLCWAYDVYLPANKYGDVLSADATENLIAKLGAKDVEGRGDLAILQNQMRTFVASDPFTSLLNTYEDEEGVKLRELIDGFVTNGWAVGLLNLAELSTKTKLKDAVNRTYDNTKVDKDTELTWRALTKVMMRELPRVKREAINALTDKMLKADDDRNHATMPHDRNHIMGYLGGVIGLRNPNTPPAFDNELNVLTPTVEVNSLQEILDQFHQIYTPQTIIDHVNGMLKRNELCVIDGMTGTNGIWILLSSAAKELLKRQGITETDDDDFEVDNLLYHKKKDKGATTLALALFLTHIGVLELVE